MPAPAGPQRPLATARAQFTLWLNRRPDGSEYVTVDVAGLARLHADVLQGRGPDAPFATGKGVTVWRNTPKDRPGQVYYRIKCHRFKDAIAVFPPGFTDTPRQEGGAPPSG